MSARNPDRPPAHIRALSTRIDNLSGPQNAGQFLRQTVANTVVAQLLPAGAVKGGAALKFRLGDATTRFTTDLGTARHESLTKFTTQLQDNLRTGWAGFTGRLIAGRPARPAAVPAAYIMQPFDIRLAYLSLDPPRELL